MPQLDMLEELALPNAAYGTGAKEGVVSSELKRGRAMNVGQLRKRRWLLREKVSGRISHREFGLTEEAEGEGKEQGKERQRHRVDEVKSKQKATHDILSCRKTSSVSKRPMPSWPVRPTSHK